MKLEPHLFFYGRCEEALEFDKSTFGGSYEARPMSDSPKIMHATFTGAGISFMASDGPEVKPQDGAEGERVFKALSEGSRIKSPTGR